MKELIIIITVIIVAIIVVMFVARYQRDVNLTCNFNKAIISLPNGKTIEGKVELWTDFENKDQIQIQINGVTYLTHSANAVLIAD